MYCSSPDCYLTLHTKFELSRTILAIPKYLHRQMLHLPVALNPKELGRLKVIFEISDLNYIC